MDKRTRPLTIRMEQFKQELNHAVSNSELPPCMLEILMGQYLEGLRMVAQKEYAQDKMEWEQAQKEQEARAEGVD